LFDHLDVWVFWETVLADGGEVGCLPTRAVEILLDLRRHVGQTELKGYHNGRARYCSGMGDCVVFAPSKLGMWMWMVRGTVAVAVLFEMVRLSGGDKISRTLEPYIPRDFM
jgi:hypothetical protein